MAGFSGESLLTFPRPSIREHKQSTSPTQIIVLQGGTAELPEPRLIGWEDSHSQGYSSFS